MNSSKSMVSMDVLCMEIIRISVSYDRASIKLKGLKYPLYCEGELFEEGTYVSCDGKLIENGFYVTDAEWKVMVEPLYIRTKKIEPEEISAVVDAIHHLDYEKGARIIVGEEFKKRYHIQDSLYCSCACRKEINANGL